MKIILEDRYNALINKFNYILNNFVNVYNVDKSLKIFFGDFKENGIIQITPGNNIVEFLNDNREIPEKIVFLEWKNQKLPFLFTDKKDKPIINRDQSTGRVQINYDILSSAFYFLSSWQEWHSEISDNNGRYPVTEHFLYKNNLLQIPVVNYYFDIFCEAINIYTKDSAALQNQSINAIVTHDIDRCKTGWKENSFQEFINGHPIMAFKTIYYKFFHKDIWFNFDNMLQIEDKLNIKASYFFIPTKEKYQNINNADYDIGSQEMVNILEKIKSQGHEIGIHGSYGSGNNLNTFKNEIKKFDQPVEGGRFHRLAINIPKTFDIIENSNLRYDSSVGFAESIGFRSGYCYPYKPYNLHKDETYSFLEFPLMVMDRTLQNKKYMGLSLDESNKAVDTIINEVEKFKGYFVLLWHNNSLSGFKFSELKTIFTEIILSLKKSLGMELLLG